MLRKIREAVRKKILLRSGGPMEEGAYSFTARDYREFSSLDLA